MPHGRPHYDDVGLPLSSIIVEQGRQSQRFSSPVNSAGGLNYRPSISDNVSLGNQGLQIGLQQPQISGIARTPQGPLQVPSPSVVPPGGPAQGFSTRPPDHEKVGAEINALLQQGAGTGPISFETATKAAKGVVSNYEAMLKEQGLIKQQEKQKQAQGLSTSGGGTSFIDEAKQRQAVEQQREGLGIDWLQLSNVFAHIGAGFAGPGQELGRSMVQHTSQRLADRRTQGLLEREELNVARGLDLQRGRDISIAEDRLADNRRLESQDALKSALILDEQARLERDQPLSEAKIKADIAESKSRSKYFDSIRPKIEESKISKAIQEKELKSIVDANAQGRRAAEEQRRLKRDVRGSIDLYNREPLNIDTEIRNYEKTRIQETVKAGEHRGLTASEVLNAEDYKKWQRIMGRLPGQQNKQRRSTDEKPEFDKHFGVIR